MSDNKLKKISWIYQHQLEDTVLPLATWILSLVQQSNVNYLGVVAAARLLITNKVLALPVNLVSFSRMLLLVICGMRVVDKIRCKTQSI